MSGCMLLLDTTTDACSAALSTPEAVCSRFEVLPAGHSGRILAMIDELLAEAELVRSAVDVIAFCRGPGSFTGVRICAGIAQGIGLALERPLLPLSTLQVLAAGELAGGSAPGVLVVMDARMNEVYAAGYRRDAAGLPAAAYQERVCAPEALDPPADCGGWHAVGSGLDAYRARLPEAVAALPVLAPGRLPSAAAAVSLARSLFQAGAAVAPEKALPVYLRDRVTG